MVPDRVTGMPGTFAALPPAVKASLVDNARIFKVSFTAPPPPKVTCEQLGQIRAPAAIVRGGDHSFDLRQPAAVASTSLQNHRSPLPVSICVVS
jgi:hypothetical protein